MKKYYYLKGDVQHGPMTVDELKLQVNRQTMVWCEGMQDWTEAKDIPEIAETLPPPIPVKATTTSVSPPLPPKKSEPIQISTERKRTGIGWWIVGGSIAVIFFFLWVTGFFTSYDPYDPCVDDPITNDEFIRSVKIGVDYRTVPLGGVRDVVVTVSNQFWFSVDDASIIVSYIRQDGSSDSYEVINTGSIEGNTTKTFSANGASRGVKAVVYFSQARVSSRCFTYTQPDS